MFRSSHRYNIWIYLAALAMGWIGLCFGQIDTFDAEYSRGSTATANGNLAINSGGDATFTEAFINDAIFDPEAIYNYNRTLLDAQYSAVVDAATTATDQLLDETYAGFSGGVRRTTDFLLNETQRTPLDSTPESLDEYNFALLSSLEQRSQAAAVAAGESFYPNGFLQWGEYSDSTLGVYYSDGRSLDNPAIQDVPLLEAAIIGIPLASSTGLATNLPGHAARFTTALPANAARVGQTLQGGSLNYLSNGLRYGFGASTFNTLTNVAAPIRTGIQGYSSLPFFGSATTLGGGSVLTVGGALDILGTGSVLHSGFSGNVDPDTVNLSMFTFGATQQAGLFTRSVLEFIDDIAGAGTSGINAGSPLTQPLGTRLDAVAIDYEVRQIYEQFSDYPAFDQFVLPLSLQRIDEVGGLAFSTGQQNFGATTARQGTGVGSNDPPASNQTGTQTPYDPRQTRNDLDATHGQGNVTSTTIAPVNMKNVHLAGHRHPVTDVPYDNRGYPVFDDFAEFDTRFTRADFVATDTPGQMRMATRDLRVAIGRGEVDTSNFSAQALRDIQGGKAQIDGFTWHHHQDTGRMQLVDREFHSQTGHVGGDSMIDGN